MNWIIIYYIIINFIGFIIMGIDKLKAKRHVWRIAEKYFFLVSLIGGSIGTWIGMYFFHHKSRHWYFVWGIPFILVIQILAVLLLLKGT